MYWPVLKGSVPESLPVINCMVSYRLRLYKITVLQESLVWLAGDFLSNHLPASFLIYIII
jgi:hypothetical protein